MNLFHSWFMVYNIVSSLSPYLVLLSNSIFTRYHQIVVLNNSLNEYAYFMVYGSLLMIYFIQLFNSIMLNRIKVLYRTVFLVIPIQ